MEERFDCPECTYISMEPGACPNCNIPLVATCPYCGNPLVGEQVNPEG